jgi:uncharacterized integral membrane protein
MTDSVFLKKKYLLYYALAAFLFIVFIDENGAPVPVKLLMGSPVHINLSVIILGSMAIGSALTVIGFLLYKRLHVKVKQKFTERDLEI